MGKRICVYCSSSDVLEDKYKEVAECFAKAASFLDYTIVCGGSCKGLMGVIIDTMISNGARVEGVIPGFMKELEFHHPGLENIEIVPTMSERKDKLRDDTDAVVAFPGGIGTLEELMETLTLRRLGLYSGEVIIFNQDGFYNPLFLLFEHLEKERVLNNNWREGLVIVDNVEDLMYSLESAERKLLEPRHYAPA
ncbi:MAG: Rossman fold protein, TIGR00730 family [Bacteroidetes bacterium GWF2_40_14]|nr:MAG: Rossman fold protein, TIGR00730 family [Bacteroidetes bacterium GWF2_40_14]